MDIIPRISGYYIDGITVIQVTENVKESKLRKLAKERPKDLIEAINTQHEAIELLKKQLEAAEEQVKKLEDEKTQAMETIARQDEQLLNQANSLAELSHKMRAEFDTQLSEKDNEITMWKKSFSEAKDCAQDYRKQLESVESELSYTRAEKTRAESVKPREITDMFLDFMAGIYNASYDIKDAEALSEMIRARTDKVIMTAGSRGLKILRTERGEQVRNGRVNILDRPSDDPEQDGRVSRCSKFGCEFANGLLLEIPEEVTVWKYVKPQPSEPEVPVEETVAPIEETAVTSEQSATEQVQAAEAEAREKIENEEVTTASPSVPAAEPVRDPDNVKVAEEKQSETATATAST